MHTTSPRSSKEGQRVGSSASWVNPNVKLKVSRLRATAMELLRWQLPQLRTNADLYRQHAVHTHVQHACIESSQAHIIEADANVNVRQGVRYASNEEIDTADLHRIESVF